jgi:general secretion pathway protein E
VLQAERWTMKKDIADILIELGFATQQAVDACRQESAKTHTPIERCLLNAQSITQAQLAQAYASYASLEYVAKITDDMADLTILSQIPLKFLRDNVIIPVRYHDKITLLTANPTHFQPLDEVNMLLGGGTPYAVAPEPIIIEAINRYYPLEGTKQMIQELEEEEKELQDVEFAQIDEKDIMVMASEAPIIKLVNHVLFQAIKRGASDIHMEPFEKELHVRYRIDGVLYTVMTPPKRLQGALISRIKIMSDMNIAEKRMPQDGRIDVKVANKPIDIRVSVLPVAFGERVVLRLLDKSRSFSKLAELDFSPRDLKVITENIAQPNGIIYITGPTGSGKTTTLYSILGELNKPEVNIITVEDPVEYQMAGVSQVQVRDKIGLTFAVALRSILRQDPDIIMIGETRDHETAQIAVQAALTGHLVLSTLHTNSAPATITRLIDMGIEPFLIASSINLAMAQRLVRRLCTACKKPEAPSQDLLASIGLAHSEAQHITFYKAVGCPECNETGYKGRIAIFELMPMTREIARLTMERADTAQIKRQAVAQGMTLLIQDGLRKIKQGLTTIEEVLSAATIEHDVVE